MGFPKIPQRASIFEGLKAVSPADFADALAQALGLGVGFVLAHQYMRQLDVPMR